MELEELYKLQKEINEEIKKIKLEKNRIERLKHIKILLAHLKCFYPYLIATSIVVSLGSAAGLGLPYREDMLKCQKYYKMQYEDGLTMANEEYAPRAIKLFEDTNENDNKMFLYTPWQKENDDYIRYKRTYYFEKNDDIKEIYASLYKDDLSFLESYTKYYEEKQTTNMINENNNQESLSASLNYTDSDDTVRMQETPNINIPVTIIESVIIAFASIAIKSLRESNIFHEIEDIRCEYKFSSKELDKCKKKANELKQRILKLEKGMKK